MTMRIINGEPVDLGAMATLGAEMIDPTMGLFDLIPTNAPESKPDVSTSIPEQAQTEPAQIALFEKGEWWEEHWRGMPEFVQKDITPYQTVYLHFETKADLDAFCRLVGQKIGPNTQSLWYPECEQNDFSKMRYVHIPSKRLSEDVEVLGEE